MPNTSPKKQVQPQSALSGTPDNLVDRIRGLLSSEMSSSAGEKYAVNYAAYSAAARKETFGIEEEICVLDLETTGISPVYEQVIEVAIARMRGPEIIDEYNVYVNPGKPISREITELTGITNDMVKGAPAIEDILDDITNFIGDSDILAHNAAFDRSFIESALKKQQRDLLPGTWLDSLTIIRCGLPLLRSFRLEDLMRAYCPDQYKEAHRAIADVRGLCHMWRTALVGLSSLDPVVLGTLPRLLRDAPEAKWISQVATLYGKKSQLRLKALRQQSIKGFSPEEMLDARVKESISAPLPSTIENDLSQSGLAGSMYGAFESRPEQLDMARAIRTAQEQKKHLVVEAGTGVGKSLAYLTCLARLAMENNINVGVATKTNALTDQLMGKDLPLLAAALAKEGNSVAQPTANNAEQPVATGGAHGLRFAALKGYSHYACLRKLNSIMLGKIGADGDADSDGDSSDATGSPKKAARFAGQSALATAQLIGWVSQTDWGELSSANVPLNFGDKQAYAASSHDCMRRRCSYYYQCYLHGARRVAKGAHIVVTNHSLLFRNSAAEGKILPPIRYWAMDEAHNLEAEARKQLTSTFSERDLDTTLKQITGSRGLPRRLLSGASKYLGKGDVEKVAAAADVLRREVDQLHILAGNFFAYVHDLDDHESLNQRGAYGDGRAAKTHWIGPEIRDSAAWGSLCSVGLNLVTQLQTTLNVGRALTAAYVQQLLDDTPPPELTDFAGVMTILESMTETLATAIGEPAENLVYSCHLSREYQGRRTASLEIAQLEVGECIATDFLEQTDSAIFTSATLAVGDSFKRFTSGIGLDLVPPRDRSATGDMHDSADTVNMASTTTSAVPAPANAATHVPAVALEPQWSTLQLASSYDLPNLMHIYVPADLPEPRDCRWGEAFTDLLRKIHLRSGGGVLTLFTSRRDLMTCRDVLQDELRPEGIDVLAQDGMLSPRVLQERFIADKNASLLATKSFWEGFDAGGDTLRVIVIPKLPFGRPDTPLARERNLVHGRSAWARYDLPEAILELKQAVGRLIRSSTDSGVVVLGDTRVLTKGYGKRVLDALPVKAEVLTMDDLLCQMEQK